MSFVHRLIRIVVEPLLRHISSRPVIRKQAVGLINEPWRSISIRTSSDSDFFREWRVVGDETGLDASGLVSNQFHADRSALQARPHYLPSIRPADRATYAPQFMPGLGKKIALLEGRSRADLQPISSHLHRFLSSPLESFSIQAFSRQIFPRGWWRGRGDREATEPDNDG